MKYGRDSTENSLSSLAIKGTDTIAGSVHPYEIVSVRVNYDGH
jgi:hypothetical protein